MRKIKEKLELTAPAGGMEQLITAVNAGADSVYMGYKKFGARAYADNFDMNQLKRAVKYAHGNGVKIYLTINTLIKDCEIRELLDFLREYAGICTDGLIIQDFCIYKIVKDIFHGIPLHASTQINLHNLDSLRFIKRLGFKRVIPARELTLDEIKTLCGENMPEVEIFVHGSQCYSYSGNCYFSSFIGGRSGNRGRCTQPCRMKYRMLEKTDGNSRYITNSGYILSKSDLCLIKFLPEIAESGVDALKIEGRMKSREYVGIVTKIYRKYIDLYYSNPREYSVEENDIYKLAQIFSRELGKGYIKEKHPGEIISAEKSGSIGNFIGRVYKVFNYKNKGKIRKTIYIRSKRKINKGDIIEIWTKKGNYRKNIGKIEEVERRDKKYIYSVEVDSSSNILKKDRVFKYLDKSLNDEASELFKYDIKKIDGREIKKNRIKINEDVLRKYTDRFLAGDACKTSEQFKKKLILKSRIYNKDFLDCSIRNGVKNIIYSGISELINKNSLKSNVIKSIKKYDKEEDIKICVDTPQIIYDDNFKSIKKIIMEFIDEGIKNFRVSNPGVLEFLMEINRDKKQDIGVYLGAGLNLFNTIAVEFFDDLINEFLILMGIELSPELNLKEICGIISNISTGREVLKGKKPEFSIFAHGYIKIMNSRYKLEFITGKKKGGRFFIEDRKGYRFPVTSDYSGNMIIFNSKKFCTIFNLDKISENKVESLIIDSKFYNKSDFGKILKSYRESVNILFDEGIKEYKNLIPYLKNNSLFSNYSKGHLFRGVE
ncbi:MAG: U32 family peptidase [Actinomycetota bacterium]|nr:U32 family peptidase [Actinomycetota bacterium]